MSAVQHTHKGQAVATSTPLSKHPLKSKTTLRYLARRKQDVEIRKSFSADKCVITTKDLPGSRNAFSKNRMSCAKATGEVLKPWRRS